jgi:hypothetical protein
MKMVFESDTLEPYDRLVMLVLAEHADEHGVCYPSVARICARSGMGERGVQGVLKRLHDRGHIVIDANGGKRGANLYRLNMTATPAPDAPLDPRTTCPTPASDAPACDAPPPHGMHPTPAPDAPPPPHPVHPNRHLTIIEPSEERTPLGSPDDEKPSRKARLPANWTLSDEGWEYARSKNIPDEDIADEARGFHAYWTDRTDADSRKSARGWEQCWAGWCRRIAGRYAKGRGMAVSAKATGHGRGGSIASVVAQRILDGKI